MVREWKRRVNENGPNIDGIDEDPQYQHSFVGPLSMSKGCDLTVDYRQQSSRNRRVNIKEGVPEFVYRGNVSYEGFWLWSNSFFIFAQKEIK